MPLLRQRGDVKGLDRHRPVLELLIGEDDDRDLVLLGDVEGARRDFEAVLRDIKDKKILERFSAGIYGFRAMMGGAATGQGFAIGPEWARRDLFGGRATLLANYQITTMSSTRGEVRFRFPSGGGTSTMLAAPTAEKSRHFFEIGIGRLNYNQVDYYGPGPDSEETGRSNYRYEDFTFDAPWCDV